MPEYKASMLIFALILSILLTDPLKFTIITLFDFALIFYNPSTYLTTTFFIFSSIIFSSAYRQLNLLEDFNEL